MSNRNEYEITHLINSMDNLKFEELNICWYDLTYENDKAVNPKAKAHFMKGRALSYGSTKEEAEKAERAKKLNEWRLEREIKRAKELEEAKLKERMESIKTAFEKELKNIKKELESLDNIVV